MFLPHPTAQMSTFTLIRTEWRFLVYGLLMSFWSSLGQTFFISLFSQEIRTSLDLSHGEFGSHYAIATTASGLTLFWLGKLADSVSVPRLSLMTLGGVCLAALHFSFVSSVLTLILGFYLLRLSGQGMMYHVYSTAVTRRYTVTRGRALALCGLGMPLGEAAFPVLVILALGLTDWRTNWFVLPLLAFFSFAPAIPYLTRRTAQQDGPGREADEQPDQPAERFSVRRRVVIQDSAFWGVVIWLMMIPGFTITGLFFHQIFIAGEKAVPFGYGRQIMSGMHCLLWPGRFYLGFWLTGSARIVWPGLRKRRCCLRVWCYGGDKALSGCQSFLHCSAWAAV